MPAWTVEGKKARLVRHVVRIGMARDLIEKAGFAGIAQDVVATVPLSLKKGPLRLTNLKKVRKATMSNPYWDSLVSKVKDSLKPEFEAVKQNTDRGFSELRMEITSLTTETSSRLLAIQGEMNQGFTVLNESLDELRRRGQ